MDTVKGVHLRTLEPPQFDFRSFAFSPDGHTLATVNTLAEIYLWNVINGTRKDLITRYNPVTKKYNMDLSQVIDLAFSPDGQTLAVASRNSGKEDTIRFLNVVDGSDKKTISGYGSRIKGLVFSLNGNTLAIGSVHLEGGTLRLWDTVSSVNKKQFTIPSFHNISFSPDGSTFAISNTNWDDTVRLWDVVNGKHKKILRGHTNGVKSMAFSPNGHLIAGGRTDNTVCLWNAVSGEHKKTLTGHQSLINSVCFSSDGQLLASGSDDKTVRLWDVVSGEHKKTLTGHWFPINSVCFSSDGQLLASGSEDKTVRLWNVNTGKHLKTLTGNEDKVTSVCFSSDGQFLASGSEDKTVCLWDINSGKHLKTFVGHTGIVTSVCFSADGHTLASGSDDGTVLLWNIDVSMPQTTPKVPQQETEETTQQAEPSLTPQQIAKKALASTVLIVMEDANGKPINSGSGFFAGKGLIVTNHHVVEKGTKGTYKQVGKDKWYNITDTVKIDKRRDLAILKVSNIDAPALPLGNSNEVQIGQSVYAVGNPIGFLEGTFAPGFVSSIRGEEPNKRIQITAPISPGSSGGPLLNNKGEVIGIVVGGITEGQNLNFAIPSNYLKELLDKLKNRK